MSAGFFRFSLFILFLIASLVSYAHDTPLVTDWSQPPVGCAEEIIPAKADRPCLDLSSVADPFKDWPENLPDSEILYWKMHRESVSYCRAVEVMKREVVKPGTFSAGKIEVAWMQILAVQNTESKIAAVYEASRENRIPAQVLTGALYQESLFAELGIADDGGNFSCGLGQVNVSEWCHWASTQSPTLQKRIGWPNKALNCSVVDKSLVKPFYEIAIKRLNGEPEYRLNKTHFSKISFDDVVKSFPPANLATQKARFKAVTSFITNCSGVHDGIVAKAHELASLYKNSVPDGLKKREIYPQGKQFNRSCRESGYASSYPLHAGWLLAVGMYNAGSKAVDALAYYNNLSAGDMRKTETFEGFTPKDLVEAFYWAGAYNSNTDRIDFSTLEGNKTSWLWFKACVLQRHIARVVQHVTLPGAPSIIESLEGSYKCTKSIFDPVTGDLLQSSVPKHRQVSSGRKEMGSFE